MSFVECLIVFEDAPIFGILCVALFLHVDIGALKRDTRGKDLPLKSQIGQQISAKQRLQ